MPESAGHSLREFALFRSVPEGSREVIEQRCRWRSYRAGEQILEFKDGSRDVCFLVAGQARVIIYSVEGQVVSFRELAAGDIFGELSAIDGRDRCASVEAKAPCLIAQMAPQEFIGALGQEPQLALTLINHLVRQVRDLTDRVFEFSTLAVNNRIHAELLRLACRASPRLNEASLCPAPTHAEIASHISTHREAVSRELSRLARIGLLKRRGSSLVITDVARLEGMVRQAIGDSESRF